MNIKKFFGSKKFKYGSVAIVLSIVFIALVLIFNVMLTVIGQRFSLYADLTTQEFYTVSQSSREQLKDITEPVEIVFFKKKEDIADPSSGSDALGYVKYLAEEYKKSFDFVDVKYVDMLNSPAAANAYKDSVNDNIRTDSVVINCPTTGKKRIVQAKGFFSVDSNGNVVGFSGEKRITSSILQVTDTDKKTAYFTTGHNEYIYDANNDTYSSMVTWLVGQGYEIGSVDLSTQDIPEGTDIVIINQPTRDFAGISSLATGGANEIEKIKNYIQNDYGNVILSMSAATPDLPELRELLEENFGVTYTPGAVLADITANTIDTEGEVLVAKPAGTPETYEYQLHKSITEKGIKIIAPYNIPLSIIGGTDKYVVPVLVSSKDSYYVSFAQDYTGTVGSPATPLVVLSSKISYDENQNEKRGNLLVTGSLLFEIAGDAYGNEDFFYSILKNFGNTSVAVDIPSKPFNDTYLDITRKDANAMTVIVTAVLPIIMLILGVAVWATRKRK
ncbi:MAG: Gldg family protein [Clostridia bacterium]|nr:Gldg family protein [Clostridia bacterium]